jgi:hypothetical protein
MNSRHDPTEPRRPDPIGSDLRELFRAGAPADPSEAEWSAVLHRVHRGVDRPRVAPVPARRWRLGVLLAASLAAAAAVGLAVAIPAFRGAGTAPIDDHVNVVELPVTDTADVEILSMDAADSGAIVVGDLPLRRPIVFMEPGDIALRSLERDPEGDFPDVHMHNEGESSPMIWAPLSVKP